MLNAQLPKEEPAGDVTLSLTLHAPHPILVSDTHEPGKVLLHLEFRNKAQQPWEGSTGTGPLLELVLLDSEGRERARQTRQCRMLAYPTRLEPGRGFNLPSTFPCPGSFCRRGLPRRDPHGPRPRAPHGPPAHPAALTRAPGIARAVHALASVSATSARRELVPLRSTLRLHRHPHAAPDVLVARDAGKRAERMYDEHLDLSKPVTFESDEERLACIKFFNAAYRAEESGLAGAHKLAEEVREWDPELAECLVLYGNEEGWHKELLDEFLAHIGSGPTEMGRW